MLKRALRGIVTYALLVGGTAAATLEVVVEHSFRSPGTSLLPAHLVRYLYERFDRKVIQMLPECAVFDPVVTYTLRPGRCTFSNREFSNVYEVNTLGLRDDEASLDGPEIVVLGDSVAMGWGVEESEAFPARLERLSGRKTLNAAVSSYATARELLMLARIDRSRLRTVIIQYSDNDIVENEIAVASEWPLRTLTEEEYAASVQRHARETTYFPGKYAFNTTVQLRNLVFARGDRPQAATLPSSERQAAAFIGVLERSPVDPSAYDVVVVAMDEAFIADARTRASSSESDWIRRIRFVDLSHILVTPAWSYELDGHQTALGQEAIAAALLPYVATPQH